MPDERSQDDPSASAGGEYADSRKLSDQSSILSQSAEKVLRELRGAETAQGSLWWSDLFRRLRPMSSTGLTRAVNQLARRGLVTVETNGTANELVTLTDWPPSRPAHEIAGEWL